jgi:hypothetical protein
LQAAHSSAIFMSGAEFDVEQKNAWANASLGRFFLLRFAVSPV